MISLVIILRLPMEHLNFLICALDLQNLVNSLKFLTIHIRIISKDILLIIFDTFIL